MATFGHQNVTIPLIWLPFASLLYLRFTWKGRSGFELIFFFFVFSPFAIDTHICLM